MNKKVAASKTLTLASAHVVCVSTDITLPKWIMVQLRETVDLLFSKLKTSQENLGVLSTKIPLRQSDYAIIQTDLVFDKEQQGYIFNVTVHLKKLVKLIERVRFELTNEVVDITFIVRSGIGRSNPV